MAVEQRTVRRRSWIAWVVAAVAGFLSGGFALSAGVTAWLEARTGIDGDVEGLGVMLLAGIAVFLLFPVRERTRTVTTGGDAGGEWGNTSALDRIGSDDWSSSSDGGSGGGD